MSARSCAASLACLLSIAFASCIADDSSQDEPETVDAEQASKITLKTCIAGQVMTHFFENNCYLTEGAGACCCASGVETRTCVNGFWAVTDVSCDEGWSCTGPDAPEVK